MGEVPISVSVSTGLLVMFYKVEVMIRLYRFDLRLCYHRDFRPCREEVLIARYPVRVSRRARGQG